MANNLELENLLSAVTEAMLADDDDLDSIVSRYAVSRHEVEGLIGIIQRLHITLVGAKPSRRFIGRLRHELVGSRYNVVSRIRYLPARVQIAAGVALVAGFILLNRRRMLEETRREAQEIPVLQ